MTSFRYFAQPPSPALAPFVEVLWGVSGTNDHHAEAVLPNGVVERRHSVRPHLATARRALEVVDRSPYDLTVAEPCDRLGLSNRYLIDQFREVVGLTPKTLFRIRRFHAVVNALEGRYEANWSRIAIRFRYADQAHLVREFPHFAGVTPTHFLRSRSVDHAHVLVC